MMNWYCYPSASLLLLTLVIYAIYFKNKELRSKYVNNIHKLNLIITILIIIYIVITKTN